MSYIVIIILWITSLYYINKFYKKKKSAPTIKAPKYKPEDVEAVKTTLKDVSDNDTKKEDAD